MEEICIDRGLTDESEILRFLQHGTLVGLLTVPHPLLIRKYQPNRETAIWFRTYIWEFVYLRNTDPPVFGRIQMSNYLKSNEFSVERQKLHINP